MEEQHTYVTQQHSADMKEDSKSTNTSSDEDKQAEEEDFAREETEKDTSQPQGVRKNALHRNRAGHKEESLDFKDKNTEAGGDNGRGMESALPPKVMDMPKKEEEAIKEQINNVETIGPCPQETTESTVPEITGGLAEQDHRGENKAGDRMNNQGDGNNIGLKEESTPGLKDINTEAGGGALCPSSSPVSPCEEVKKTKTAMTVKQPEDSASSSASINNHNSENTEQEDIKNEHHKGENKQPETTTSLIEDDRKDDPVDSHRAGLKEDSPDIKDTNTEPGEGNGGSVEPALEDMDMLKKEEEEIKEPSSNVETISSAPLGTTESIISKASGMFAGMMRYLIPVGVVVVIAILVQCCLKCESPPQRNDVRQIDVFRRQLEKVNSQFPSQRAELWKRSGIHLQRHLQTAQPTEPVSLILTAGLRAERTLHCLAQGLASAFSSAMNASVLYIDGVSQALQDSDQVKLFIDRELQGAFEGDKPVAVIHRFEELPPGSTLIFYRYCDHENAAYKKTFLIFTVLLGEEEEISAKTCLSAVEEMVDDHLQKKFISHGRPVSFDTMDRDKYGGLWSRISHLILPVAAEERIEREGCKAT